ncbi:AI-2E family transporter [Vacuolonema iberomarrocanum]|uniref:AI-2E family transporter n=1 Tax=Vacuolonema iberomarrocanum TaxID=3454632 RepID=UPI001A024DC1|nr:AI-2E family transporter [filamentous cyanobacterium LEGE 07170]
MNFGAWLGLLALVLSLYILWEIRQLLLLVFVAVVFATALSQLVKKLQRLGIPRGLAIFVGVGGTLGLTILFGALIVPPFLDQLQELTRLVPQGLEQLETWINDLLVQLPGEAAEFIPSVDSLLEQVTPLATELANNFFRLFSGFFNVTLSTLFALVLTIMLTLNPQPYRQGFVRFFPSFYRRRVDEILTACEQDLVGWIIGTLINMVVIGLTSGVVLSVLGVRLVLANSLLAGLLEAIPNIGPVLATVAPAAIALLDAPWKALAVIVSYLVIQQLEQFVLVPVVMGQQVSLLPAITLLAQIVFASFFGFLGLFLAIPLLILVRILLREVLVIDVLDRWQTPSGQVLADPLSVAVTETVVTQSADADASPDDETGAAKPTAGTSDESAIAPPKSSLPPSQP